MTYDYHDPGVVLRKLRSVREALASSVNTPKAVATLRTRKLQPEREAWDAAVLCELLSLAFNLEMKFARVEALDYDAVYTWAGDDCQMFAPIQLKELVPEDVNPKATVQDLVSSLRKYRDSSDLIVGIKLNRNGSINFNELDTTGLTINELWLFGATTPDQSRWSLFGDALSSQADQYEFELPYI